MIVINTFSTSKRAITLLEILLVLILVGIMSGAIIFSTKKANAHYEMLRLQWQSERFLKSAYLLSMTLNNEITIFTTEHEGNQVISMIVTGLPNSSIKHRFEKPWILPLSTSVAFFENAQGTHSLVNILPNFYAQAIEMSLAIRLKSGAEIRTTFSNPQSYFSTTTVPDEVIKARSLKGK